MNNALAMKRLLLVVLWAAHFPVWAEGEVAFSGILVEPPPCTINDGGQVEVPFGDRLGVNKVDGVNYRRAINYQVSCEKSAIGTWALTLTLSGDPAIFDDRALRSDKSNLGILVYQNNEPFKPGSRLKVALANLPRLEAVPVKKSGATLTEGKFEALATLTADYQ